MPANKKQRTLLSSVRSELTRDKFDAFIIGSGDAHQSEYVCKADMRRQFITGFSGSAGTALILQDKALLWTDGRYFLQAENELSDDWTLMRSGQPGVLEINDWMLANMATGQTVGVDAFLMSTAEAKRTTDTLKGTGINVQAANKNPVDIVWSAEGSQPTPPCGVVKVHDISLAGVEFKKKIETLQECIRSANATSMVVTMLDEIAWLLNIRGSDIAYNPVTLSYVVVTLLGAHLFINAAKLQDPLVTQHLLNGGVTLHPYEDIEEFIGQQAKLGRVLVDPAQLNWQLYQAIQKFGVGHKGGATVEMASPITIQKSVKNSAELSGVRASHVRDGAALTAFLFWLEDAVKTEGSHITEYDVAVKIEEFRKRAGKHLGPSFDTIAGFASNGAIIHYKPEKATAKVLSTGDGAMFLLDSGAQYLDGTTDVTRTLHFGTPSDREKLCYTLVLQGHIALARAVFPEGTMGSRIDCLARVPLWAAGLDYNHGTGHGVGAFLNVHEGPQSIGFRKRDNEMGFQIGMTTSNEPGYYEEGNFGIRIETVCITVEAPTPNQFNGKRSCALETVTLVPICTRLIALNMLSKDEIQWLDEYHLRVRQTLLPVMTSDFPEAVGYLIERTQPLDFTKLVKFSG